MLKLGQYFLVDKQVLAQIIKAADLSKNDKVLEIGPGKGVLTREIAKRVKKVIAVELDKNLASKLKIPKVQIINKNILDYKLPAPNYKIIGNMPYYITGKILRKFSGFFSVYMLQKEVAERICSKKGSILSISVQSWGKPEIISLVPKTAFSPVPKVDSAIIKIIPRKKPYKIDFNLVKKAFSQKRKKLKNTININSDLRPEDLSLKQWEKLSVG
ncbi:MAG: 16S rRNA (adenine(1518)-N(6)/adenine(1519)-N(6))-dimethyltransferase RsmA [bacterium]